MKQARRGFHYPLDPIRRKGAWEADALKAELARRTATEAECAQQLQVAEHALAQASQSAAEDGGVLQLHTLRLRVGYIAQLSTLRETAAQALADARSARDETMVAYGQQRKFLNGLDEHRSQAVQEHDKQAGALESSAMDDFWLQSRHWREANKCA